jgi:[protein-PII] uridylyltransferase
MPLLANALAVQDVYASESEKIRVAFACSYDGEAASRQRSALVDSVILQLWNAEPGADSAPLCVAAIGGYGRGTLFPCSDIDLLFVCGQTAGQQFQKSLISKLCQALWDLHLRAGPSVRTLQECGVLQRDNFEFGISLLDCRYLCGEKGLFEELRAQVIPRMVAREAPELMRNLWEMTRRRHQKYGHTIFHLEPNIKEYPGGMRDYQVACWQAVISGLEKSLIWPAPESLLPQALRRDCNAALEFLSSVRCFLHYQQNRNLNVLTYDLQAEAASRGIGLSGIPASPADWMRAYFRHVRAIYRLTVLQDEVPAAQSGLYRIFQNRKSRLSNADFAVVQGRVFLRQRSALAEPSLLFSLFEFVARHGVKLSAETERCVEAVLPEIQGRLSSFSDLWEHFRRILVLSHAGVALRAMHRLGFLVMIFKEFQLVDSLVIRDYYHRHTVDEHSFVAIEAVHALNSPGNESHGRFRDILLACDRPELLFLALLFHDVGKGMPVSSHVEGSLGALPGIFDRLRLEAEDCEIVRFLIANHLHMSATILQRNIFDPETVQGFAESVGTIERLKMLTLFTYADISAVNPQALTPWKAEMLWRLFAASENFLNRSVDDQRLHTSGTDPKVEQIAPDWTGSLEGQDLHLLLDGFPRRYLVSHTRAEILAHAEMWRRLRESGVQVQVAKRESCYQLTLLTTDRRRLFATIAGVLSCWQMDILKAEAFCNKSGVVLDTIRFADRFRNLELNPPETRRLEGDIAAAVSGEFDVDRMVDEKGRASWPRPKLTVQPRLRFDNECSSHSTLLELIAGDRPGLLYDVSTAIAELGCNIEVALIDTQGQTALDVFYLTWKGGKLNSMTQDKLRAALLELVASLRRSPRCRRR